MQWAPASGACCRIGRSFPAAAARISHTRTRERSGQPYRPEEALHEEWDKKFPRDQYKAHSFAELAKAEPQRAILQAAPGIFIDRCWLGKCARSVALKHAMLCVWHALSSDPPEPHSRSLWIGTPQTPTVPFICSLLIAGKTVAAAGGERLIQSARRPPGSMASTLIFVPSSGEVIPYQGTKADSRRPNLAHVRRADEFYHAQGQMQQQQQQQHELERDRFQATAVHPLQRPEILPTASAPSAEAPGLSPYCFDAHQAPSAQRLQSGSLAVLQRHR